MRILHLVQPLGGGPPAEPGDDLGVLACRAAIDRITEHRHLVVVVGNSAAVARASALGVNPCGVCPVLGRTDWAWRALHREVMRAGMPDVVQVWAPGLRRLAAMAVSRQVPVLEALAGNLDARLPVPLESRDTLRTAMGIPHDRLLVASVRGGGWGGSMMAAMLTLGRLFAAGITSSCLFEPIGAEADHARRYQRATGMESDLVPLCAPVWSVLPAADVAVLAVGPDTPARAVRTIVATTHAAGVPVVTAGRPEIVSLYDAESASVCLAADDGPDGLCLALLNLLADPARHERIRAGVRAAVMGDDRVEAMIAQLRMNWTRVAGRRTA